VFAVELRQIGRKMPRSPTVSLSHFLLVAVQTTSERFCADRAFI